MQRGEGQMGNIGPTSADVIARMDAKLAQMTGPTLRNADLLVETYWLWGLMDRDLAIEWLSRIYILQVGSSRKITTC